jgi:hypothetical protein
MPDGQNDELMKGHLVPRDMSMLSSRVGGELVLGINPEGRALHVHRRDGSPGWLREWGELSGEDVVLGCRCPVSAICPREQEESSSPSESATS